MATNKLTAKLGLDNKEFKEGLRSANQEVKRSGRVFSQTFGEQKTLIKAIERDIKQLQKTLSNAAPGRAQQKVLGNLRGAKRALAEETGTLNSMQKQQNVVNEKVIKSGNKLMSVYGGIAIAIGSVAKAFGTLKKAVLETETGMNRFNIVGAATKQLMYDMLQRTPIREWGKNMKEVAAIQANMNELRVIEREDLAKAKVYQVTYLRFLSEAKDQLKTNTERIKEYEYALAALNKGIDIENKNTATRLALVKEWLKTAPDNEKLLEEESKLTLKLLTIEQKRYSRRQELESMMSGLQKSEIKRLRELEEAYNTVAKAATSQLKAQPKKNKPTSVFEKQTHGFIGELPGIQDYGGIADPDKAKEMADAVESLTDGLDESQQSLVDLAGTFSEFFSDVNLGFEDMIQGAITGIKRLVMELIANAFFITLLSALFPGAAVPLSLGNLLPKGMSSLINSGGGGGGASASLPAAVGTQQLMASLNGKQIDIILNRS